MADDLVRGLEGFEIELPPEILDRQRFFLGELLRWNQQINLTSIRNPAEALEKHLIDALYLLKFLGKSKTLLDIGSGGGLPGIPLAIAQPDLQVTTVDSVGKKIHFQKHVRRSLSLTNLQPINCRIEELARFLAPESRFEVVTARAFASLDEIVRLAEPWLAAQGQLLLMKGPEGTAELHKFQGLLADSRLQLIEQIDYRLPFSRAQRVLIRLGKY